MGMAYNICRPIVLYNDFLPPDDKPHDKWQYIAFGYFDGVKVGENIFQEGQCSLERLWDYDVNQMQELDGRYSAQIIYGFRSEEDNGDYDNKFWKEALDKGTEYPFIFVVLIQGTMEKDRAGINHRRKLEENLSEEGRRQAITYLTLDNSSMLLILLCREYEDGAVLIDGFHRKEDESLLREIGIKLSYSYTVSAVQKKFLNSSGIKRLQEKRVGRVYIYAIERQPGSIEYIREKMDEKCAKLVRKESILGCNDEVMIIEDMSWYDFLTFFQDENGRLNHSCPEYRDSFIGLTTIITGIQNDEEALQISWESPGKISETPFQEACRKLGEKLRGLIYKVRETQEGFSAGTLERYLYQITNALQKFENTPVQDYIYYSMYLPVHMVLQIAGEAGNINNLHFYNAFYEFVKSLNLCVQNSVRSDRQFTQSLDLDIRIYNAPVRLNAFYNAFLYYMKRFLGKTGEENTPEHEYEFLTSLGVVSNVQVRELFKNMSENKRLFFVSIPENQIYDMKLMLIMLSHEVGHFVGQTVRNREYRYDCAVKIVANITAKFFKVELREEYAEIQNETYWRVFEQRLDKFLRAQIAYWEDKETLKKYRFRVEKEEELNVHYNRHQMYRYYTHWLKEILLDSVDQVLIYKREELFGYLGETEYLRWVEQGVSQAARKQRAFSEKQGDVAKKVNRVFLWDEDRFSVEQAIDMMMSFFKECEADLVAILTLELSLEDYLYAVWKSASDQGRQDWEIPAEMVIRSGLVACCMYNGNSEKGYCWTDIEWEKVAAGNNPGLKEMAVNIRSFLDRYFGEESSCTIDFPYKTVDAFLDSKVLECIAAYLLKCKASFQEALEGQNGEQSELKREQEQLMDIYRKSRENAEELVWDMQEYIDRYKQCLQEEIQKKGEETEEREYA